MTSAVQFSKWWQTATRPGWPNNLEPGPGPRSYRGHPDGLTEAEAREYCREYNETHEPGRYSRKAEYESE